MKNYNPKIAFKQRGMTLIELSVVLLILVGLAGLLLPYVGSFSEKTQNSSAADTLAEVNKSINRFEAQYQALPDKFDSLVIAQGTGAGGLISWFPTGGATTAPASSALTTCTLGDGTGTAPVTNELGSLKRAEMDSLYYMQSGTPTNATFDGVDLGFGTAGVRTLVKDDKVACIKHTDGTNPSPLQALIVNKMGIEVDADDLSATATDHENEYVVFGVGQKTQMTGKVLSDAPVYFTNGNDNPTSTYARFLAVFKVSKEGNRATYVGALTPDLKTSADFLESFHASIEDDD